MIDIYTVSIDDNFISVWGDVIAKSRCKVHTDNAPISDNCWYDENGDYVTIDAEGNIIPAPLEDELDMIKDMPDNYEYGAGPYLMQVTVDNQLVLQHPNAIFILDIPEEKAKNIQESYGVICQSLSNTSKEILKINFERDLSGEAATSWEDCFSSEEGKLLSEYIPSNSLVIIDRYLFTGGGKKKWPDNNEQIVKEMSHGIKNVQSIIKCLIPRRFKGQYRIVVMYDPKTMVDRPGAGEDKKAYAETIKQLSNAISVSLNDSVKKEFPDINILLEILCVEYAPQHADYYAETHDRRILSNYYLIRVTKNLKAFKNGQLAESQNLFFDTLFSKGLETNPLFHSDPPYVSLQRIVDVIKRHLEESKNDPDLNRFFQNGVQMGYENLKNYILI